MSILQVSLSRRGLIPAADCFTPGLIDNLTYSYGEEGRLTAVSDAAPEPYLQQGFKPGAGGGPQATHYQYDHNGNMTDDAHKNMQFEYNFLNLPLYITTQQGTLHYLYDATGRKWAKSGPDGIRFYAGNIEYLNGQIQHIAFPDGRLVAEYDAAGTSVTGYRSEYFRTDHLGNTRLTFSDFNQDGVISWKLPANGPAAQESEITSENHYYPFGLSQTGPWYASVAPENKYLFNGIERNTDWGLNLDMADFRAYDPTVGRWWQVDPIIKFHESVYAGFANNPLIFTDFMGADTLRPIGTDFYDGGNLPTVTVTASAKDGNGDQSMERYGFGGTFAQWQQVYGYQGWSYEAANNYWNHVYQADFEQYVWRRDSVERARIALEKMWFFTGGFSTIGQIYGAGGMPGRLPSPRGFSFSSPVASTGGSFSVYQGVDKITGSVKYIGITERTAAIRFSEHLNSVGTGKELLRYSVVPGATNLSRLNARIMEQTLINQYGLKNLLNVRNSIAPKYWPQHGIPK